MTEPAGAYMEMPRYTSHKKVWALKIKSLELSDHSNSVVLVPVLERYAPIPVSAEYINKHHPQAGGYFVQYADGYQSFSPADAFEKGNTLDPGYTDTNG